jgi:hypothetical protein
MSNKIVAQIYPLITESKVTRLCEKNNNQRLGGDFRPFKSFLLGSLEHDQR